MKMHFISAFVYVIKTRAIILVISEQTTVQTISGGTDIKYCSDCEHVNC